jgi:uncharacterized cupredoxin-like copper-binding protein
MRRLAIWTAAGFAIAAVSATTAVAARVPTTHVNVTAGKPSEFHFTLSKKRLRHGRVVFKIVNRGALPHDFKVCAKPARNVLATTCRGKGSRRLSPGKSVSLTVIFKAKGRYEYLCTVPGHAAAGMKGTLRVT